MAGREYQPVLGNERYDFFHFRQQAPVGPYIADFADLSAKLVVEADGSQHGLTEGAKRDAGRTRWLEGQGFKVLRFWNNDVLTNIDGVMTSILVGLGVLQDEPVVDQSSERIALTPTHSPSSAETGIGGKRVATQ